MKMNRVSAGFCLLLVGLCIALAGNGCVSIHGCKGKGAQPRASVAGLLPAATTAQIAEWRKQAGIDREPSWAYRESEMVEGMPGFGGYTARAGWVPARSWWYPAGKLRIRESLIPGETSLGSREVVRTIDGEGILTYGLTPFGETHYVVKSPVRLPIWYPIIGQCKNSGWARPWIITDWLALLPPLYVTGTQTDYDASTGQCLEKVEFCACTPLISFERWVEPTGERYLFAVDERRDSLDDKKPLEQLQYDRSTSFSVALGAVAFGAKNSRAYLQLLWIPIPLWHLDEK